MGKARLWVTYAWADNADKDVDYILRQLENHDELDVRFDRRQLVGGQRLWEQIGPEIERPERCDAWAIIATPESMASPPCKEELEIAIGRAVDRRTEGFPLIALLYKAQHHQLPPSLKNRLSINMRDADWVQQVADAAHRRPRNASLEPTLPWYVPPHQPIGDERYLLEVRPRVLRFAPFIAAVRTSERSRIRSWLPNLANTPHGTTMITCLYADAEQTFDGIDVSMTAWNHTLDADHSLYLYLERRTG